VFRRHAGERAVIPYQPVRQRGRAEDDIVEKALVRVEDARCKRPLQPNVCYRVRRPDDMPIEWPEAPATVGLLHGIHGPDVLALDPRPLAGIVVPRDVCVP
jgi:hypothetical protein